MRPQIWKDVVGYEGYYQVSDRGLVRSLSRVVSVERLGKKVERRLGQRYLRPAAMPSGHLQVSLTKDGKSKSLLVHILVLEAFKGPRPGDSMNWHGCHEDGEPSNNRLTNLRWDTRSGNEMDKVTHGRSNRGTRNRASKLSEVQAKEIKARIALGEQSPTIALLYGVSRGAINAIKCGRAWGWL